MTEDLQLLEVEDDLNAWRTPPDAYDTAAVWKGTDSAGEFVVEAAAFRGKPTYFIRLPRAELFPKPADTEETEAENEEN